MCIFAKGVSNVRKTRIFVSPTVDERQITIYENNVKPLLVVDSDDDSSISEKVEYNAMILPCPIEEKILLLLILVVKKRKISLLIH